MVKQRACCFPCVRPLSMIHERMTFPKNELTCATQIQHTLVSTSIRFCASVEQSEKAWRREYKILKQILGEIFTRSLTIFGLRDDYNLARMVEWFLRIMAFRYKCICLYRFV